jgi:putative hemolysin
MIVIELAAVLVLLLLSAAFSGSETVLFSLTNLQRSRIREKNQFSDKLISKCLEDSAMLLSTLLVGNTFVNFAIGTLSFKIFTAAFPSWGAFASVPVATILLLLFGEITPKRLAMKYGEQLAPLCAMFLIFWKKILSPFNVAFRFSARAFSKALERERRALSDAELVSVIEASAESGDLASADAEMISGVLRLAELHANDEMTPRVDIEGYDIDLPEKERNQILFSTKHERLPVYKRTSDAIEGVIDVATRKIEDALFVPEQVTLDDLLVTFRKSGKQLAIVTDEYGGTAGIITLNDILEIIMGPRVFGPGADDPSIVKKTNTVWQIDARASIDEINRTIGIELAAEDADRLSGWVAFHTERIPHVGQSFTADGCRATILKRRKRRVVEVKLEVLEFPEVETDEEMIAETDEAAENID